MPIQFNVEPLVLVITILALVGSYAYYWRIHNRTLTDMSVGRKRLALAIRLTIVTLLFLAIAQTRWMRRNDSLSAIFVVDASRSIRPEQREAASQFIREAVKRRQEKDSAAIVTFGQNPHIATPLASDLSIGEIHHAGPTNATNIADAIETALTLIPRENAGKVVLLSDGNENVNNALSHVPSLAARGVKVDTVILASPLKKEALIEKMLLPPRVKIGEPFTVKVVTQALNPQSGRLTLRRDGQPVGTPRVVEIPAGRRVHNFEVNIDKPGFYRFESQLETNRDQDTILENNRGLGFVTVRGKPQILYVAPTPDRVAFLRRALKEQNIDVEYVPPAAMPTNPAAFQQFDSVILSDVPRDAFASTQQMQALQVSTRDFGVGFGMIGGENSFGVGGYRGTPIEETLPVSLEIKKQKRMPSVAVALVIEDLEIPTTVNMSKEAAKALIDLLDPMDEVGVLDCAGYGSYTGQGASPNGTWRIPLQHVTDRGQIQSQIDKLDNMGDPPNYDPYFIEAARALQNSEAKIKHIIFLGDGDAFYESSQGGMSATMRQIRNMGITVSTVATAADPTGISFMQSIARDGGGHSYVADQPADLPRILLKDQQTISSPPIIEEPFTPRQVPGDDVIKGIGGMPTLLGYNIGTPKPSAGVSMLSHRNDPILATWRYGLGRSMAFMSDDKNKWAAHWVPWQGYGQFWAQAMRWTMRSFAPSDFQTQVVMEGTRGHIIVDAIDKDGKFVNRLAFRAKVAAPDAERGTPTPEVPLRQTAPGHYEAWFDAANLGTYLVNVIRELPDKRVESAVTGLVVPYSPEYKDLSANDFLMTQLAQIGGGKPGPNPAQVFGSNRPEVFAAIDLYPGLLLLAMLLFPFDVAVRRLALQREDFARVLAWLRARIGRGQRLRGVPATPEMARLRDVKQRALAGVTPVVAEAPSVSPEHPSTRRPAEPAIQRPAATPTYGSRMSTFRPDAQPAAGATADETSTEPQPELAGMSRLMAAKQRAKNQQKPRTDE